MRHLFSGILVLFSGALSGCHYYLDNPPVRTISGTLVVDKTGQPLANANISFYSGRKVNPYYFPPWETFGVEATATTDANGHFFVQAKLNNEVHVLAGSNKYHQEFKINGFPESNILSGIVWRISMESPTPQSP